MTITSSSLLTELNISCWTASAVDKTATDKTIADASATAGAGKFRKSLLAGTTQCKEIADYAAGCRTWHIMRTLPWLDKGGRLLPMSLFFDYKSEIHKKRQKFEDMVDDFVVEYPNLVTQAQNHLGTLFKASDYPSASEVKSKFAFKLLFSPVPEAGDFRVQAGLDELAELREQYETSFDERIGEAMASSWERLHGMLVGMSAKLTDIEGEEKKKRYHETLLGNAHELCSMLTHLNVTKDPKLEQARQDLEKAIFGIDIDDIRLDPMLRGQVKGDLDKILAGYW